MSTFIVYGVTRSRCKESAHRKVSPFRENGSMKSQAEFFDELAAVEEHQFKTAKAVAVSPWFDAPSFAIDWMKLAREQSRDLVLMVKRKTGIRDPRSGKEITEIVPYRP